MSQKKILCDVTVGPGANEWYGTLIVSNIHYEDDSSVTIQEFLGVVFKSPEVTSPILVNPEPWISLSPEISSEPYDASTITVTAKLAYPHSYTFNPAVDKLNFGINGNLRDNQQIYTDSFELYPDALPSGTVLVECPAAPDAALASSDQMVQLKQTGRSIQLTVPFSATTPFTVPSGTYAVIADELTIPEQTVVATAHVSPDIVTVTTGEETTVNMTYGAVSKYSALDVTIGNLSSPVDQEEFHVQVIEQRTNQILADFFSPTNHTTEERRLPSSGTIKINAQIILNNVKYFATKSQDLSNTLYVVSITETDVRTADIDSTGFVELPVEVDTDLESDQTLHVRLTSMDKDQVYTQAFKAQKGTEKFSVMVAPGTYTVEATGFIEEKTVYAVNVAATLTVVNGGGTTLQLKTQRGANLGVRGFPGFLSFGGLSDLVDLSGADFVRARASSLFKYAGNDGAGDPGRFLSDDPATTTTVNLASTVEAELGGNHSVLPVMISYTCNLSLGDIFTQLQNKDGLTHSFANLILSLQLAQKGGKESVPAGYVLNPDFLGECQKTLLEPSYDMPVREPLQGALDYWSVPVDIPSSITDTLKGYVLAVNWLIRTVVREVTFGWQVNVWGVGNSEWIYSTDSKDSPKDMAKKTADYIRLLEVYDGEYKPDFLAIDRYEADDFTMRAYVNGYCYGPYEWRRFFDFCSELSLDLQVPVMPWQIPASRIPLVSDTVNYPETEHWGTGGTYILGDDQVNSDYHNINRKILEINPSPLTKAQTVEDIFIRGQPFDFTNPAYGDFPLRGIFTVLLGGGATTGIVSSIGTTGPWTQNRLNAYMDNPIQFA